MMVGFIFIHMGYYIATVAIVSVSLCHWSNPEEYGTVKPLI